MNRLPLRILEVDKDSMVFSDLVGVRVFDKLKYAQDFIKGNYITHHLKWYSNKETAGPYRQDDCEGWMEILDDTVDWSQPIYRYTDIFDGKERVFLSSAAKADMESQGLHVPTDAILYMRYMIDCNALCLYNFRTSDMDFLNHISIVDRSLENMKKKGLYAAIFRL